MKLGRTLIVVMLAVLLSACAAVPSGEPSSGPLDRSAAFRGWVHMPLPGKATTSYSTVRLDGREALEAQAQSSASVVRRRLSVEPMDLGSLRFSWRVPGLIREADMGRRDADDAVVRVALTFDGDRSSFSARDSMLSELTQLLTGEPLPYATLMYVWCNQREVGSVINNPRTGRIRKLVVQSGQAQLDQWLDYERDIRADFRKVFGEEPGRLIGVAVMTDTDNTASQAQAWYGPVQIEGSVLAGNP